MLNSPYIKNKYRKFEPNVDSGTIFFQQQYQVNQLDHQQLWELVEQER